MMNIEQLAGRIDPLVQNRGDREPGMVPAGTGDKFASFLEKAKTLKFSGHAQKRIDQRAMQVSEADLSRLQDAVSKAEQKGSRDALILDGKHAYVVNIPNKTVVTAMDMMELREKVFTNIDSTIITKTATSLTKQ